MLDTQVPSPLLLHFGAEEIPRERFLAELQRDLGKPIPAETLRAGMVLPEEVEE